MRALLLKLADIADGISLPAWHRGNMTISHKPDGSPVTDVDVAVETALRAAIGESFPNDGFRGEEVGQTPHQPADDAAQRMWIVDGIDGTRAFTSASPAWSTHIALTINGSPVAGIVTCPALASRWYSSSPGYAYVATDDERSTPLAVSNQRVLADSRVARWPLDSPVKPELAAYDHRISALIETGQRAMLTDRKTVSTAAMMVADGRLDAFVMFGGQSWDHAAPAAVVSAAGGRFSCLAGTDSLETGAGIYSNGQVHDALVAMLQSTRSDHDI